MTSFDFTVLEPVLAMDRAAVCANVLEACRPWLPQEPENGWIEWLYDYLTLRLYPDRTAKPLQPDL